MPQTLILKPIVSAHTHNWSKSALHINYVNSNVSLHVRAKVTCKGILAPRKFNRRKKQEVFKDAAEEADHKNWRRLMMEIEENGSAVSVLRSERNKNQSIPKEVVLGTLVRFKQLKKWNLVSEILEWLRSQNWWDFGEMDFLMLITAYGKLGDFNRAEKILSLMNKKGYVPSVISHTALMEAYGKGRKYNNAEAIFRRMQSTGPEPSAVTYQLILKIFVEAGKFKEAEDIFNFLLDKGKSPLKPDQKMYHMMIYMYKKARSYDKARNVFSLMAEHGIQRTSVTFNSLMSFEKSYKEVFKIYDQMQRAGLQPDVVSYALLISAYGKARREEEALAVFEDMLDAGVRPTHKAYNILLDAFAISGMMEQAQTVFKSMRRDRFSPDLYSYSTMLSAYVNVPDMEGAEKFFTRLKRDGFKPNVVIYGTLIKGYAKINNLEKMIEKYEEMLSNDIKPNVTILTTIMDAHGKNKDFDSAVVWYKEMEHSSTSPDQKAKNILLSLAKTTEEKEEAKQLTGRLDQLSIKERTDVAVGSVVKDVEGEDIEDEEGDDCVDGDEVDLHDHQREKVKMLNGNQEQNFGLHATCLGV